MSTPYQERTFTSPEINPGDEPFFESARRGELLFKHCNDCDTPHYYPRPLCPHCFSSNTSWKKSLGLGTIYTFSVCRKIGPTPYAIAYVTLDEGFTMLSNIVDCDLDDVRVGQAVRLTYKSAANGDSMACFAPV